MAPREADGAVWPSRADGVFNQLVRLRRLRDGVSELAPQEEDRRDDLVARERHEAARRRRDRHRIWGRGGEVRVGWACSW